MKSMEVKRCSPCPRLRSAQLQCGLQFLASRRSRMKVAEAGALRMGADPWGEWGSESGTLLFVRLLQTEAQAVRAYQSHG